MKTVEVKIRDFNPVTNEIIEASCSKLYEEIDAYGKEEVLNDMFYKANAKFNELTY